MADTVIKPEEPNNAGYAHFSCYYVTHREILSTTCTFQLNAHSNDV